MNKNTVTNFFQAVIFNLPVKNIISVLINDKRHIVIIAFMIHSVHFFAVIIAHSDIKRFALAHNIRHTKRRFLKRCVGVETVMIKNIDIINAHSFERLVERGGKIFSAASPAAVRTGPHFVAGLCGDYDFIAIRL